MTVSNDRLRELIANCGANSASERHKHDVRLALQELQVARESLTASQKRVQELEAAEHERKQMSLPVNVRNAIGAATARGARE